MASSASGARIETRELSFAYGGRRVLRRVGLRVEPGEVVGLLGPNGSGKSTLIKIVSAVLGGYGGSARIDEREVRELDRRDEDRDDGRRWMEIMEMAAGAME